MLEKCIIECLSQTSNLKPFKLLIWWRVKDQHKYIWPVVPQLCAHHKQAPSTLPHLFFGIDFSPLMRSTSHFYHYKNKKIIDVWLIYTLKSHSCWGCLTIFPSKLMVQRYKLKTGSVQWNVWNLSPILVLIHLLTYLQLKSNNRHSSPPSLSPSTATETFLCGSSTLNVALKVSLLRRSRFLDKNSQHFKLDIRTPLWKRLWGEF